MEFFDRVSAYPNRYIMTDESGKVQHVVLERADEPITPGTPLNAETFNAMLEMFRILSPDQYGETLPETGVKGQIFFLKKPQGE